MITDLVARMIACDWHGGQSSALYALCSSGAIIEGVEKEINECYPWAHGEEGTIESLEVYVRENGPRGPVEGWGSLNW